VLVIVTLSTLVGISFWKGFSMSSCNSKCKDREEISMVVASRAVSLEGAVVCAVKANSQGFKQRESKSKVN